MPADVNDWGRRLDANETSDAELLLAERLKSLRPYAPAPTARFEAELRVRLLNGDLRPAPLTPGAAQAWRWALTVVSCVILAVLMLGFYVLSQPLPAAAPIITATRPAPTPTLTPSPAVVPSGSDLVSILSVSPPPGSLLSADSGETVDFEMQVNYYLDSAPEAAIQIWFARPDWAASPSSANAVLAASSTTTVTQGIGQITMRFPLTISDDLRRISSDGRIALFSTLTDTRTGTVLFEQGFIPDYVFLVNPLPLSAMVEVGTVTPAPTPTPEPTAEAGWWSSLEQRAVLGEGALEQVLWSPDGETIAVAGTQGIHLYAAQTFNPVNVIRPGTWAHHIAFSPDGRTLAVAGEAGSLTLWGLDARGGVLLRALTGHMGRVHGVVFSPDGRTLASAGADSTARLWDAESGELLVTFRASTAEVTEVAFSPDGRLLASSGHDAFIRVWDVERRALHFTLTRGENDSYLVDGLAFSPDGRTLLAGGGSALQLWDVATGEPQRRISVPALGGSNLFAISPDGQSLALSGGYPRGRPQLNDMADGHIMELYYENVNGISSLAFSPDGQTLAFVVDGRIVRLWGLRTPIGAAISLAGDFGWLNGVALNPAGDALAIARGGDVRLWTTALTPLEGVQFARADLTTSLAGLAFNADGSVLAAKGAWPDVTTVWLWDTASGEIRRSLPALAQGCGLLVFNPVRPTEAAVPGCDRLALWDIETGRRIRDLNWESYVRAIAYSPDGKVLAASGPQPTDYAAGFVRLWRVDTGETVREFRLPREVIALGFNPADNGRTLALLTAGGSVELWDVEAGDLLRHWAVNAGWSGALAFSPDGQTLAVGESAALSLWDAEGGHRLAQLRGHTGPATWLAFLPDGRTLLSGSEDGTVRVWGP